MSPRARRRALLVTTAALLGLGIVAVASASAMVSAATYGHPYYYLARHLFSIAVGLAAGLACLWIPFDQIRRSARWLFAVSVLLLVLVWLAGPEVGGAKRWLRLGRFSVQPSEFAQLALVLYLADLLARKAGAVRDVRRGLLPPLLATGLLAGLVLIQPDLGTTAIMGAVALLLLAVADARPRHLGAVVLVGLAVLLVLLYGQEYRRRRLLVFWDPSQDPQGSGYQILQSYLALASGGLIGVGVGQSLQRLFYLPSGHADFLFAILGEELGLVGATAVLVLFGLFVACGLRIAVGAHDRFSKYLVCGLTGMIGLEAWVNLAVVTGLIPTKGLPLPFLSYGGTSMVVNLVACALVLQAGRHGQRYGLASALGR
jgi:cell division protein FtsW